MRGLKIVKYYSKVLKKYTIEQAMEDSLAFSPNTFESKILLLLAERTEGRISLSNRILNCHNTANIRANYNPDEKCLYFKMVADINNNINEIKEYLRDNKNKNLLKHHRRAIMPGIINRDFLREGNFIKIKGRYYNIEILFFTLDKEKVGKPKYLDFYKYLSQQTSGSEEAPLRKSYIFVRRIRINEDIIPYRDLSISKSNQEAVNLLCENTMYSELPTEIILEHTEKTNGFNFFYPMNEIYIDIKWMKNEITKAKTSIKRKEREGYMYTKYERKIINTFSKILSGVYVCSVEDYDFVNYVYMKD